ncbi:MAG: hypothetical protein ACRETC_03235 [Gammaproteobacteria bacterium]
MSPIFAFAVAWRRAEQDAHPARPSTDSALLRRCCYTRYTLSPPREITGESGEIDPVPFAAQSCQWYNNERSKVSEGVDVSRISINFSVLVASCVVFLAWPGTSLAFASGSGQQSSAPQQATPVNPVEQAETQLSPIIVNGQKPTLPVILQAIKQGLKQPVSFAQKDLDKVVCRIRDKLGTHFQTLACETNRQILRLHTKCGPNLGCYAGTVHVQTIDNPGRLLGMVRQLPPKGSSYTLRITDHGKMVKEYIVKDGKVVKVLALKSGK